MSFFGFDNQIDLESERRKFLEGEGQGPREDIAVYTWGEQGYDGLGNELQEGGDELNDETFGGSGQVGEFLRSSAAQITVHRMVCLKQPLPALSRQRPRFLPVSPVSSSPCSPSNALLGVCVG